MGNIFVRLNDICCGRELKIIRLEKKFIEVEEMIEDILVATACCSRPKKCVKIVLFIYMFIYRVCYLSS